jgi:hypothetical protein
MRGTEINDNEKYDAKRCDMAKPLAKSHKGQYRFKWLGAGLSKRVKQYTKEIVFD